MSFSSLLVNTVVVEKRTTVPNETGEEAEVYSDGPTISASVQDRSATELARPDVDGPVRVDAVIFTEYADGLAIAHRDVLRQTDVSPARRYLVIAPNDAAGRHHHFEHDCQRIETLAGGGS